MAKMSKILLLWVCVWWSVCCMTARGQTEPSPTFPVNDCSVSCGGDYLCLPCKSGTFKARCFRPDLTFPNMLCCTSYASTYTTCDPTYNPKCCLTKPLSGGAIAGIAIGAVFGTIALALITWWLVRRYRRQQGEYDPLMSPSPTVYAEQFAAHQKRSRPYAPLPPGENNLPTVYGTYQSY